MKTVDVLVDRDRSQHGPDVEMRGQGQLNQDSVDGGIGVEPLDPADHGGAVDSGIELVQLRMNADLGAGLDLVVDVDARNGVVADENDSKAGHHPGLSFQRLDARLRDSTNFSGNRLAIEHNCRHIATSTGGIRSMTLLRR